tara:strand:- start:62 stop:625 length:564 start_codon:yes stop_codon:yes gene_type:complete
MHIFIIFIIILLILIYLNYYYKFNKNFEILQLTSNQINHDVLHEKLPIVIEDIINNIDDFMNVVLTYNYIFKNKVKWNKSKFINKNLSSYLVIYNTNDTNSNIYISNPKFSNKFKFNKNNSFKYLISDYVVSDVNNINDVQFVKISLKPKQVMILPSYWLFYIDDEIDTYFLSGICSNILSIYLSLR